MKIRGNTVGTPISPTRVEKDLKPVKTVNGVAPDENGNVEVTGSNVADGKDGRGIKSIVRTSGTGAAGTTDTYTITYTDDTTSTFTVYNGKNGTNGKDGTTPHIGANGNWFIGETDTGVAAGGSDITVDNELSTESENPVQNKVITQEFQAFGQAAAEFNSRLNTLEQGGIGGGGSGGVSSWNDLTDKPFGENADGTVKQLDNKYLEPFEFQAGEEKDVLPLHSIEALGAVVEGSIYGAGLPLFLLAEGEIYNVAWNDGVHTCTAKLITFNGAPTIGLGNFALAGLGEDTEEPFLIGVGADGLSAAVYTTTSETPITVRVYQSIPDKWLLKEKCLPDAAQPVSIDLSGLDTNGTIVETYADGTTKTTTLEFDASGNPIKITDGDGNVTTLTW